MASFWFLVFVETGNVKLETIFRGCSSAGRAPGLQPGGHRFDPGQLHQRYVQEEQEGYASVIGLFLQQYQRKAQRGAEPNDRQYDRKIERYIRRMKPEELDKVLNGEEDDRLDES